jgi:hypothetical protein
MQPLTADFRITMAEILYLFERRPSDVRWLERADSHERAARLAYMLHRTWSGDDRTR